MKLINGDKVKFLDPESTLIPILLAQGWVKEQKAEPEKKRK